MESKKTVFILIDALRHDYLSLYPTTFFEMCKERGLYVKKLKPSIGYCERVEILTGKKSTENGYYTAIGFNKSIKSNYWFLKYIPNIFKTNVFFSKSIRFILNKLNYKLLPYNIPLKILPYLFLTEDKNDHTKKNAFSNSISVVDIFLEKNIKTSWNYTALGLQNGNDYNRISNFKKDFTSNNYEMFYLFLSPLDAIAHKYGPISEEVKKSFNDVSNILYDIYSFIFSNTSEEVNLIILGDHGMAEVNSYYNIEKEIKLISNSFSIKPFIDFYYFVDSTSLRLWPISQKFINLQEDFYNVLNLKLKHVANEINENYDKSIYGHKIWVLNEGSIFFPDFFHSKIQLKGMHGYDPKYDSMNGTCLIVSNKKDYNTIIENASLSDLASTLCSLNNIDYKPYFKGRSLL